MNEAGQTICLTMIVKDEAEVIARCIASVRPLIDSWAIVDTGSRDATRELVRELLADLPGELIERPWVDFGHNRTEALAHARGRADYLLVIDADEALEYDAGFALPPLSADAYDFEVRYDGIGYVRRQLLRDALPWAFVGVLHEHVECEDAGPAELLPGVRTHVRHDGARARDPLTYRRDALVLERALLEEPDNARYVFYLAQSHRDAGLLERAIDAYERRIAMGGWQEEVWFSRYQIAQLMERLQRPWPEVQQAYLEAYSAAPDRAEPLFRIGLRHQAEGQHALAHLFFARAVALPRPGPQRLFVEQPLHDYLLPIEYGVAAYYVGDHATAIAVANELLRAPELPPEAVGQVVRNRRFSLDALHPPPPDRQEVATPDPAAQDQREPAAPRPAAHLLLVARDPGAELEEAVETALRAEAGDLAVVVVDDGSREPLAQRLPRHERLAVTRNPKPFGEQAAAAEFVAACPPDDVVLALPPRQGLATPAVADAVRARFADPACLLVHGPRRGGDGRPAGGEPAPARAGFDHDGGARWRGGGMVAFRAGLWQRLAAEAGAPPAVEALWRGAGFDGTRFVDEPLTRELVPHPRPAVITFPAASRPVEPAAIAAARAPSVSCLMISRDRLALARLAIRCFADQSHADRELVIVSEADARYRRALQRTADELELDAVRIVAAEPGAPLGALRNLSMAAADGDVLCQWDDDDLCHPLRIATQLDGMQRAGARACFLTDHLQFVERHGLAYWIDWTLGGRASEEMQLFPGTVMLWKDERFRYPEEGPYARRGEDSVLVSQLFASVPIARLPGMGHLYVYRFHGRNTFPEEHHLRITACASPTAAILPHAERIREALAYYPLPKPLALLGADGPVLSVS